MYLLQATVLLAVTTSLCYTGKVTTWALCFRFLGYGLGVFIDAQHTTIRLSQHRFASVQGRWSETRVSKRGIKETAVVVTALICIHWVFMTAHWLCNTEVGTDAVVCRDAGYSAVAVFVICAPIPLFTFRSSLLGVSLIYYRRLA